MNAKTYFRTGLSGLRAHPHLVVGLYALSLAASVLVVFPVHLALQRVAETTALPLDLSEVSLVEWWWIVRSVGSQLGLSLLLGLLAVPLHGAVRALVLVGIAATLRPGNAHGVWVNIGRFGWRGWVLALICVLLAVVALVAVGCVSVVLAALFPGEVGIFWTQLVVIPTLLVASLALLDLFHDYARAALVVSDASVGQAVRRGVRFPFRHGTASRLYLIWFILALGLWLLPFAFDSGLKAATWPAIALLFVLQQAALFLRAAATIGWTSSSVRLYADVQDRERLWIAEVDAPDAAGFEPTASPGVPPA